MVFILAGTRRASGTDRLAKDVSNLCKKHNHNLKALGEWIVISEESK